MDINEKDEHGKTAFWNAYKKGRIDLEMQLIKLGVDINTTNLEGITPLEDAKARGYKTQVKMLIEEGAIDKYKV